MSAPGVRLDKVLQRTLESMYRLGDCPPVEDFRIDREVFVHILGDGADRQREALLVQQDGDETLLALFICEDVMTRARGFVSPTAEGELDAFCVATEGVSHYVYFTYCGERLDRPVSQIELELQAEVDKFVVLRALFGISGDALLEALFDRAELAPRLTPEEHERYRLAHRVARRYARWFDRTFRAGDGDRALDDARRLYRKTLTAKLDHIARAA